MKITKLLPVALALLLVSPAFADPTVYTTQSSELTLTVPDFFNITIPDGGNYTSAVTITDDAYTALNVTNALVAPFHVVTNKASDGVTLSATAIVAGEGNATAPALYASGDDLHIAFTNTTSTEKATTSAIQNITKNSSRTASENANVIAFSITPSITPKANSGAAAPTKVASENTVKYTIVNGEYDFVYTLGQTALPNTFSTMDQSGTYKATLTLSRTTP